jgi:hypothetical protein
MFLIPSVSHDRINPLVQAARYPLILKYYQCGKLADMSYSNLEFK